MTLFVLPTPRPVYPVTFRRDVNGLHAYYVALWGDVIGHVQRTGPVGEVRSWTAHRAGRVYVGRYSTRDEAAQHLARVETT